MKKHLGFKACVLLVVIFFHSFVLVPRVNATIFEAAVARQAFMAASPYAVITAVAGMALVMAINRGFGTDVIAVMSNGVTALKNWFTNTIQYSGAPAQGAYTYLTFGTTSCRIFGMNGGYQGFSLSGGVWTDRGWSTVYANIYNLLAGMYGGYHAPAVPTVPTDYAGPLVGSQPSMPSGSVWGTPGSAARVASGTRDYGITVSWMPDAQVGALLDSLGGTTIDPQTGAQDAVAGPTPTENTVTEGDSQQIGLLSSINTWVTNLLGIKDSTNRAANTLDNSLIVLREMSAKLDNVGSFPQSGLNTLDNIAINTGAQLSKLDNIALGTQTVATKMDNVVQAVTGSAATPTTLSTRIASLQSVLSNKFPFSLSASLSVTAVTGASTYEFMGLQLAPGVVVPIDPMAGPLGSLLTWARQIVVYMFWAGTLLAILHRGMAM